MLCNKLIFYRDLDHLLLAQKWTSQCCGAHALWDAVLTPVRHRGFTANLSQKENKGCLEHSANFMTCKSLHTSVIGQNRHTDRVLIFNQNGNYHC